MATLEKSASFKKFLNPKKDVTPQMPIPSKTNTPLKDKVEALDDGNIDILLSTGAHYKGKIDSVMQITGSGHLVFQDVELGLLDYQGNFLKNKPDGFGELNLEDAKISYKGNFNNNKVEGIGRLNSNDYIYYGQWIGNKFNGYGRIMKRDFALYEGLFVKDRREGCGVEIYKNSDVYLGEFKNDARCGLGTYFFQNGGFYYGFFKNNMRDGFGILYDKRSNILYRGYWKMDKKEGRGIEFYRNESKYNGYFENNMRNGIGFMEYNKNLLYMGEWRNNQKHGSGKLDVGKKSVMGKFFNDEIVDNCFIDASPFADKINNNQLEETMEEYLKNINYNFRDLFIRGLHDLYKILKDSLVEFVMKLVEMGQLRLKVYIVLRNLFSKAAFENILEDIKIFLKYEPNIHYLENLWEPSFAEIFRDKTDYNWNIWIIDESRKAVLFNDKHLDEDSVILGDTQRLSKTFVFTITKTEDTTDLIISHRIAKGESETTDFEGALTNSGFELRHYSKDTGELLKTLDYTIYPYFITLDDNGNNFILSTKVAMYSGEFYFYNDNSHPLNLVMFLSFDNKGNIYSVGLDSIGVFIIAGEYDKQKNTGRFVQKYFQDYKIEYESFLMTEDKIQGYWSTTNINGHFILRKNTSFKFSREVAALMEIIVRETDKLGNAFDLTKEPDVEVLLKSSIISVLIHESQGGIPEFGQPVKVDEDLSLFEKYKKKNDDEQPAKTTTTKTKVDGKMNVTMESLCVKDNSKKLKNKSRKNSLMNYAKSKNESSINTSNLSKLKNSGTPTNESHITEEDEFKRKLSKALKQLKQTESLQYNNWQHRFDLASENITWVGHRNILGKEEAFVIENLFILDDRIEGLYIDEKNIAFELAGSYSVRTKDFEIIGLSHDKTKTVKFKGDFRNFELSGTLINRSTNSPQQSFAARMFGYDAKCDIHILNEESSTNNLACILKVTDNYLYAIIVFDKDYVFLNGYKNKALHFNVEINTMSKKLKNCSLTQVLENEDPTSMQSCDNPEKKLSFISKEVTITIRY